MRVVFQVRYEECDTIDTARSQDRYSNALAWSPVAAGRFSSQSHCQVHTARMNTRRQLLDRQAWKGRFCIRLFLGPKLERVFCPCPIGGRPSLSCSTQQEILKLSAESEKITAGFCKQGEGHPPLCVPFACTPPKHTKPSASGRRFESSSVGRVKAVTFGRGRVRSSKLGSSKV